jgi:hypothetical protein
MRASGAATTSTRTGGIALSGSAGRPPAGRAPVQQQGQKPGAGPSIVGRIDGGNDSEDDDDESDVTPEDDDDDDADIGDDEDDDDEDADF